MHVPSLIDKVRISWIPPLVDSISFRSELSFFFLSSLLAAHRSCYFAWGFALLAAGAQKHMSRCHSAQRLRTRGIEWVYLLRAIRRRQRPGAVKCCAQPSVFSQWSNQTNPSDKQLGKINLFLASRKLVDVSTPGSLFLKSLSICHMALENSITTKNGDNHVALCGLAASLKIFM